MIKPGEETSSINEAQKPVCSSVNGRLTASEVDLVLGIENKAMEIRKAFDISYEELLKFYDDPLHDEIPGTYLSSGKIRLSEGDLQRVESPIFYVDETGETSSFSLGEYPMMTKEESLEALKASVDAFDRGNGEWPKMSPQNRMDYVLGFVEAMKEKREEIINMLIFEIGKNTQDATKEFDRTVDYIVETVKEYEKMVAEGQRTVDVEGVKYFKNWTATGPTLCMGPYNYPLNETFTTLIPALLVGNTIVYKPAKFGVLFNKILQKIYKYSFPKGVVNVIYGDGQTIVTPIIESGEIVNFAFIGSDKVADGILNHHPLKHKLNAVLGLGAKNAGIVFEGCDIEKTAEQCLLGSLSYNGQRCTALKILFVSRSIADEFKAEYLKQFDNLKFGNPWDKGVKLTPIPDKNHLKYLKSLLEDATDKGANILNDCGGMQYGSYMHPAILGNVTPEMQIYSYEQFGPIVPIVEFDDPNEIREYLINSKYGQQASMFFSETSDIEAIKSVGNTLKMQVCRVNINTQCQRSPDTIPFSGRKDSALRILSIRDALEVFAMPEIVSESNSGKFLEMFK